MHVSRGRKPYLVILFRCYPDPKPHTVAVSRLLPQQGVIVRMPVDEFHEMLKLVLDLLPKLPVE